jgi:hypothetical protein
MVLCEVLPTPTIGENANHVTQLAESKVTPVTNAQEKVGYWSESLK